MNQSSAPGAQQVLRRGNGTGCLIDGDRGHPCDPALTGHKNPGPARRLGPELIQGRDAPRQNDGDLHPIAGELVESHGDRDRGVVPGRDHDELVPLLPSGVRNRREDGRRTMTELRGEQHAHRCDCDRRQQPRRKIGPVGRDAPMAALTRARSRGAPRDGRAGHARPFAERRPPHGRHHSSPPGARAPHLPCDPSFIDSSTMIIAVGNRCLTGNTKTHSRRKMLCS